jgi:hypothetical protein
MIAQNLIDEIAFERTFHDIQWGGPAHDDKHTAEEWFSYMAHQADNYNSSKSDSARGYHLVKLAALAVAALESYDRGGKIKG